MYKVEEGTDIVYLSLSYDSTCFNKLHSAWEGYEMLVLTPTPPKPPATEVTTHHPPVAVLHPPTLS